MSETDSLGAVDTGERVRAWRGGQGEKNRRREACDDCGCTENKTRRGELHIQKTEREDEESERKGGIGKRCATQEM